MVNNHEKIDKLEMKSYIDKFATPTNLMFG